MVSCKDFCLTCKESCCTSKISDEARGCNRVPKFSVDHNKVTPVMVKTGNESVSSCTFLKEDGLCSAYSSRPLVCSSYPFFLFNVDNNVYLGVSTKCDYGRYISIQISTGEITEDLINVLSSAYHHLSVLTKDEINSWTKLMINNYSYIFLISQKLFLGAQNG